MYSHILIGHSSIHKLKGYIPVGSCGTLPFIEISSLYKAILACLVDVFKYVVTSSCSVAAPLKHQRPSVHCHSGKVAMCVAAHLRLYSVQPAVEISQFVNFKILVRLLAKMVALAKQLYSCTGLSSLSPLSFLS